jgi:hypothetical protein
MAPPFADERWVVELAPAANSMVVVRAIAAASSLRRRDRATLARSRGMD